MGIERKENCSDLVKKAFRCSLDLFVCLHLLLLDIFAVKNFMNKDFNTKYLFSEFQIDNRAIQDVLFTEIRGF